MNLTSPRVASLIAVLVLLVYVGLFANNVALPFEAQLIFLLIISLFIGIASFNFANNEMKATDGALSVFELGSRKFFGITFFSLFIIMGYDTFVIMILELFSQGSLGPQMTAILQVLLVFSVGYLYLFPFLQGWMLTSPGEQSSIPSEYVVEAILEKMNKFFKWPIITTIVAYLGAFVLPVLFMRFVLNIDWFLSLMLWAFIPPLISISALAGSGIGEDLIRLRLIRNPFKDLRKLGLPKISLRELKFETGGLFLVLFAVQALITTAYFGTVQVLRGIDILERGGTFGTTALILTLLNKGRGASKEIMSVWGESGFKVSISQLFLPIFVFLGVIFSSILEVFTGQETTNATGILVDLELTDHIGLTSGLLAVSNFVMIATAIYVLRRTPGTAERRLIKECREVYMNDDGSPDISGYLYLYGRLKSDRSIENLLKELSKMFQEDPSNADLIKEMLNTTLESKSERVQIAASQTLYVILSKLDHQDEDYLKLAKTAINSPFVGAKIYAIRSIGSLARLYEGVQKEELIEILVEKVADENDVIAWDSGLALQHLIIEEEEYRNYVLALIIRTLMETENESTVNSIGRFLNRITKASSDLGLMAIGTLGVRLSTEQGKNISNLITGVRSILRGDPYLARDLIDQISLGINMPDIQMRKNSYEVILSLAEYSEGLDDEIFDLLLQGINDEAEEVQKLAYEALAKEVGRSEDIIDMVFTTVLERFEQLRGVPLLGALEVLEAILKSNHLEQEIFDLIKEASNSSTDIVVSQIFELFTLLAEKKQELGEDIYYIVEKHLGHSNEKVREQALYALGAVVASNAGMASIVYRKIKDARMDASFRVQLAAIEALGHIASANRKFADEISTSLRPLLEDDNWQVRLSSYKGLFAASKSRRDLHTELAQETISFLVDGVGIIREQALDTTNWLVNNTRGTSELLLEGIRREMKTSGDNIRGTLYDALEILATRKLTLALGVVENLMDGFETDLSNTRVSALKALKAAVGRYSRSEQNKELDRVLNKLMTRLLKAANKNSTAIRKNAYEAITEICAAVPKYRVAKRGRQVIDTALRNEKDVALISLLEHSKNRAAIPL